MKFTEMALFAVFSLSSAVQSVLAFGGGTSSAFAVIFRPNSSPKMRQRLTAMAAEPIKITMPALSSTMKEGRVVSWLKSEGDAVDAGEAIMVVESDKADMDVEAFEEGFIAKIFVQEGDVAPVGDIVAYMASEESDIELISSMADSAGSSADAAAPSADQDAAPGPTSSTAPECDFSQIDMPALSSTMKEGKVVSWLKAEGDPISAGEAIMVVESDKADMDVEAFEDGFLAAIIIGEGETGTVGAPVCLIAQEESDISALKAYAANMGGASAQVNASSKDETKSEVPSESPAPARKTTSDSASGDRIVASPFAKKKAQELGVSIETVSGTGPGGRITASDVENAVSGTAPAPDKKSSVSSDKPIWTPAPGVIAATPTARALAKKAKIDLSTIKGTGEFGRVTADDIKIATGEKKTERAPTAKPGLLSVELPDGLVPFTGMQRAVRNNMEATLKTPVFRVSREIEMDNFDNLYQNMKAKGVTVSALLAKAVALAIEKHPVINSAYSPEGTVFKKNINIAMAVSVEGGLITPTLKNANERDIIDLGENWKELVQKAKTGKLSPDEYNSGTFVISNMGMFGVTQFDAILPSGIGSILSIGGTQECIVPDSRAILGIKKAKKMVVTLTCDHRQIYGADAALFLKSFADIMANKVDTLLL